MYEMLKRSVWVCREDMRDKISYREFFDFEIVLRGKLLDIPIYDSRFIRHIRCIILHCIDGIV